VQAASTALLAFCVNPVELRFASRPLRRVEALGREYFWDARTLVRCLLVH